MQNLAPALICFLIAQPAWAQQASVLASTPLQAGVHVGSLIRYGEGWHGTTDAFGGWITLGGRQVRLDIDVARSGIL
jgi:hypothetical protein